MTNKNQNCPSEQAHAYLSASGGVERKRTKTLNLGVHCAELPALGAKREDGQDPHSENHKQGRALTEPLQANRGEIETDFIQLVLADGGIKQVLIRRDNENAVFIDWLTFTCDVRAFVKAQGPKVRSITDDDVAELVSSELVQVLGEGFGISRKNPFGLHFHRSSFVIGDQWGVFCVGHAKTDRFLISLSGEGWLHAPVDAGKRLFDFLARLETFGADVRISRIDLAVDFYSGGPTHDEFEAAYHRGEFVRQRRHLGCKDAWPNYQIFGCAHTDRGRRAGLTDAIGVRTSDLYLRRYDKGRELGAPDSEWVRVELEIKSKDTLITLDVLAQPELYFSQYPWLERLQKSFATRFETKRQRAEITVDAAEKIIKNQFGKYLTVLRGLADSDSDLLNRLQSDDPEAWPKRLSKIAPQSFLPWHQRPTPVSGAAYTDLSHPNDSLAASDFDHPDGAGISRG